jgi:glycosyltransferase involved in cell wall biosynthesis
VVEAFNKLGKRLKIVGVGPQLTYLKSIAKENIEFLGLVSDQELVRIYWGALALIFPTKDDLGLVPLEAHACGRPVLALGQGGARETVVENQTGLFFDEQTPQAIIKAVENFEPDKFTEEDCRTQAEKFSKREFKRKFQLFVEEAYFQWKS